MWLADGFVTAKHYLQAGRAKTKTLQPQAGYTSKDYDYIEFIRDVLHENGIGCYIAERARHPRRAQIWNLNVTGHKRFQAWYQVIGPELFGRKAEAARALASVYRPDFQRGPGVLKPQWQQDREEAAYLLVRRLNSTKASETIMVDAAKAA